MKIQNLLKQAYLVDPRITPVPLAETAAFEGKLGIKLPEGYAEYVARFGEGAFCNFIRVHPPLRIENETADFQQRMRNSFFWDGLSQELAATAIPIADSFDGDELIACPGDPAKLWILPRHSSLALELPYSLLAAFDEWVGKPRWPEVITFEPFVEQESQTYQVSIEMFRLSEVKKALQELALHSNFSEETEEGEAFAIFFYESFWGKLTLWENLDSLTIRLDFAPEKVQQRRPVTSCLEKLGVFKPPPKKTQEEQEEDALWIYISMNFQHLLPPNGHLSLSRKNPSPSQKEYAKAILEKFGDALPMNRCPHCEKLTRTPNAKQCLICGHQWRD